MRPNPLHIRPKDAFPVLVEAIIKHVQQRPSPLQKKYKIVKLPARIKAIEYLWKNIGPSGNRFVDFNNRPLFFNTFKIWEPAFQRHFVFDFPLFTHPSMLSFYSDPSVSDKVKAPIIAINIKGLLDKRRIVKTWNHEYKHLLDNFMGVITKEEQDKPYTNRRFEQDAKAYDVAVYLMQNMPYPIGDNEILRQAWHDELDKLIPHWYVGADRQLVMLRVYDYLLDEVDL